MDDGINTSIIALLAFCIVGIHTEMSVCAGTMSPPTTFVFTMLIVREEFCVQFCSPDIYDEGNATMLALFDLGAVFNMVDHVILLRYTSRGRPCDITLINISNTVSMALCLIRFNHNSAVEYNRYTSRLQCLLW